MSGISKKFPRRHMLIGAGALAGGILARPAIVRAAPKSITIWHPFNLDTEAAMREGEKSWKVHYPDIVINERIVPYQGYRAEVIRAVASGDVPDICCLDATEHLYFSSEGLLTDLTDLLKGSSVIKANTFRGPQWSTTQLKGKTYGIPRDSSALALVINRDMFRKAGLDPTKPPSTWDELADAAKKLTSADHTVSGLMFCARSTEESTFYFLPFLWQAGGDVDRLDGPEAEAALQYVVDFVRTGSSPRDVLNSAVTEGVARLISGTAAMSISGPWDMPHMAQQAKFDWSVEKLPVRGHGMNTRASVLGGWNWAVPLGAQNPEGAWQLIEWMSRPEQMAYLWPEGHLPPRNDVKVDNPAIPQAFAAYTDEVGVARQRGPYAHWPDLSLPIQTAIQQAIAGQVPVKTALKTAADAIRPILQKTPLTR